MRLYRLCENKHGMDLRAYKALREDISLAEALELEAARCILRDEQAEFADFYQEHRANAAKPSDKRPQKGIPDPAKDDIAAEIEYREGQLQAAERRLMEHRMAIALPGADQSKKLNPKRAQILQKSIEAHRKSLEVARDLLEKAK